MLACSTNLKERKIYIYIYIYRHTHINYPQNKKFITLVKKGITLFLFIHKLTSILLKSRNLNLEWRDLLVFFFIFCFVIIMLIKDIFIF
jgi:hypothetical protein